MLKIEMNGGNGHTEATGSGLDIIIELAIACSHILGDMFDGAPKGVKEHGIKMFFETVLKAMEEGDEE